MIHYISFFSNGNQVIVPFDKCIMVRNKDGVSIDVDGDATYEHCDRIYLLTAEQVNDQVRRWRYQNDRDDDGLGVSPIPIKRRESRIPYNNKKNFD